MTASNTIKTLLNETKLGIDKLKSIPVAHRVLIQETLAKAEDLQNGHADDPVLLGNVVGLSMFIMAQHIEYNEKQDAAFEERATKALTQALAKSGAITPDSQFTRIAKAVCWPVALGVCAICLLLSVLAHYGQGEAVAGIVGKTADAAVQKVAK